MPASPRTTSARARDLVAPVVVLLVGSAIALWARWGPDWPAQEFRGWLAGHYGLIVWTNNWYGGTELPGYSVLYPVLAAGLSVGVIGVAAAALAANGAVTLTKSFGYAPGVGLQLAVALVLGQLLLIGQLPFLLGAAFGVWALRFLIWDRRWAPAVAAVLAALSSLSSPLAAVFVIMLIPAAALAFAVRRSLALGGAVIGLAVPVLIGGEAGRFATQWESLVAIAAFVVIAIVFTRRDDRALRCFAASYLLATVVIFVVPNPVGSNITRLGKLIALPLAVWALSSGRVRSKPIGVVLVLLATTWTSIPFVTAIARGAGDDSRHVSFSAGLVSFLRSQDPANGRLEIPFTREHWETDYVARAFPLARGWERQLDLHFNSVLYRELTASAYRHWLDENAVALVALPAAPIDYGGRPEATLLRTPPSYLEPIWHDRHWTVWRVRDPTHLVSGAATVESVGPASFVARFARAGTAVTRFRASTLWQVTSGAACIAPSADGWLVVRATRPGAVTLRARLGSQPAAGC